MNAAVTAALATALGMSSRYEYGGVLVACEGRYFATAPVTTYQERRVDFTAEFPVGCALAGLYHTHPGASVDAVHFPAQDIQQARALGVPSYIIVSEDGMIRVYDPRSTDNGPVQRRGSAIVRARGKFVTIISPRGCRRNCVDGLIDVRRMF